MMPECMSKWKELTNIQGLSLFCEIRLEVNLGSAWALARGSPRPSVGGIRAAEHTASSPWRGQGRHGEK
jgi:hypothetical protein